MSQKELERKREQYEYAIKKFKVLTNNDLKKLKINTLVKKD
jgi:hypothetical protein